jgi:hypothetical protein
MEHCVAKCRANPQTIATYVGIERARFNPVVVSMRQQFFVRLSALIRADYVFHLLSVF